MSDDLYDIDITAWSDAQADRLRRLAAGERVNDVDWAHVIEEIEDVAQRHRDRVTSNLTVALEHVFKLRAMPGSADAQHWRHEAAVHLRNARRAWQPGMVGRLDLPAILEDAATAVEQDYGAAVDRSLTVTLAELVNQAGNPHYLVDDLVQR